MKYTEHTHSQSGTQDLKQCQIIQCKKMGSFMVNNTVYCLCQPSKGSRHTPVHVTCGLITSGCSAGKGQTLDCWLSQATLAAVGSGQGLPITYCLTAKPWQKRQGAIWIHLHVACRHGFEYPVLKAAGSYQQMLVSARQSAVRTTIL